jgi:nicotinamide-nucleotide amidase
MNEEGEARLAARLGALLSARGETLALAEGASGGWLAHRLTEVPGSSAWLRAGIVAYTDYAKQLLLRVSTETVDLRGGISAEATVQMARLARRLFSTTWGLALTGYADARAPVAGPPPAGIPTRNPPGYPQIAAEHPPPTPGLTFLAVSTLHPSGQGDTFLWEERHLPAGDRATYKAAASAAALEVLLQVLGASPQTPEC